MTEPRGDAQPPPHEGGYDEPGPDLDVRGVHHQIMREASEPRDGFEPVPVWLIFLYFGIVMWCGIYLGLYSGGFEANRYSHEVGVVADADLINAEVDAPADPIALGKRLYNNCVACHQSNGEGVAGQFPPLVGASWLLDDKATPVRILLNGLGGPIEVRGETYNANMPAFGARFSDQEIAAVLTYVRQAWSNDAPPIGSEFVNAVRQQTIRTGAWNADALRQARQIAIDVPEEPSGETEDDADADTGTETEEAGTP